jgi:hypothetical protein
VVEAAAQIKDGDSSAAQLPAINGEDAAHPQEQCNVHKRRFRSALDTFQSTLKTKVKDG